MNRPYKIERPAGVEKFILKNANEAYLLFSKKENTVFCTIRNAQIRRSANKLAHNKSVRCSSCSQNCEAIPKETRYGRQGLTETGRVLWFTKEKDTVYAQLDEYKIDYQDEEARVTYNPVEQYKISAKERIRYEKQYPVYFGGGGRWERATRFRLPKPASYTQYNYGRPPFFKTLLYTKNLEKVNVGPLRYADTAALARLVEEDAYEYLYLLYQWCTYRSVELLYKAGFTNIIKDRALEQGSKCINWRGTSLKKILRCSPAEVKALRRANPNFKDLEAYRRGKDIIANMRVEFIPLLRHHYAQQRLIEIEGQVNLQRAMEYICSKEITLNDYCDHLRLLSKTGQRKNSGNFYPDDFHAKHEELTKLYAARKKASVNIGIKKAAEAAGKLEYSSGDLTIVPAKEITELDKESHCLGHCIRTYDEKISEGRAYIFFIRRQKEPETPYYTLELSPSHKLVQCRGDHNCDMTDEVRSFVQEWMKFVNKQTKKKGVA